VNASKCKCIRLFSHCEILQWISRCLSSDLSLKSSRLPSSVSHVHTLTHTLTNVHRTPHWKSLPLIQPDQYRHRYTAAQKVLLIHSMPVMTYTHTLLVHSASVFIPGAFLSQEARNDLVLINSVFI